MKETLISVWHTWQVICYKWFFVAYWFQTCFWVHIVLCWHWTSCCCLCLGCSAHASEDSSITSHILCKTKEPAVLGNALWFLVMNTYDIEIHNSVAMCDLLYSVQCPWSSSDNCHCNVFSVNVVTYKYAVIQKATTHSATW